MIVLDMLRAKLEEPDIVPHLAAMVSHWQAEYAAVEAKASGFGGRQEARRRGLPVRELTPRKAVPETRYQPDKYQRSFDAQVRYESGQVWHPKHASWLADFESEMLHFSADLSHAHDDQVDVVCYAAHEITQAAQADTPAPFAMGAIFSR